MKESCAIFTEIISFSFAIYINCTKRYNFCCWLFPRCSHCLLTTVNELLT